MRYSRWMMDFFALVLCGFVHAEIDTLDKLRAMDWNIWPDANYELALMGDEAVPFLLDALSDESREARWHAAFFLKHYYGDERAGPGLTDAFLHDTDEHVRRNSVWALAGIDPTAASDLMATQLEKNEDQVGQKIAISMLIAMKDRRVIPALVRGLEDNPHARKKAALALAQFSDERAIPALIDFLSTFEDTFRRSSSSSDYRDAQEAMEFLIKVGDEETISMVIGLLGSRLDTEARRVLPKMGASSVPLLLKMIQQTKSQKIRDRIIDVWGNIHEPEIAPTYGEIFLNTDNETLRRKIADALANMGEAGLEYLLLGLEKENCQRYALRWLATYNSQEAVDAVIQIALSPSYPLRAKAVGTLGAFIPLRGDAMMAAIRKLLGDRDPKVKLYTLRLVRDNQIREVEPILRQTLDDADAYVREAASQLLASFSGQTPLQLTIQMSQKVYRYGRTVEVKYKIANVSKVPVTICTQGTSTKVFSSGILFPFAFKLEIRKPDTTLFLRKSGGMSQSPAGKSDFKTLEPGDVYANQIPISEFYSLYQPGSYTIKIHYRPFSNGVPLGMWGWSGKLTSPEIRFEIASPSDHQFKAMLAKIDMAQMRRGNARAKRQTALKYATQPYLW